MLRNAARTLRYSCTTTAMMQQPQQARRLSAPAGYETATLATESSAPVGALAIALEGVHIYTGLPWWGSIVAVTAAMRTVLLPLTAMQMRNATNMAKARPEIERLVERAKRSGNQGDPDAAMRYRNELAEVWRKYRCHPVKGLAPGIAQIPLFASFFYAIRGMSSLESFQHGGIWFFEDLSSPATDPYCALPVASSLLMAGAVELGGPEGQAMTKNMKWAMRGISALLVPLTATFPKGLFVYWITTNVISVATTLSFQRMPLFRRMIGAPPKQSISATSPAAATMTPSSGSAQVAPSTDRLLPNKPAAYKSASANPGTIRAKQGSDTQKGNGGKKKSKGKRRRKK